MKEKTYKKCMAAHAQVAGNFYRIKDACEKVGIHPSTYYRFLKIEDEQQNGKIKLRVEKDDILVFILLIICIFFVGGLLGYIVKISMES